MNLTPEALAALRAMLDLSVVRAPLNHPGYRMLRERRLAAYNFSENGVQPDYRLTDRGHTLAVELFR